MRLTFEEAIERNEVVALADSAILRHIDQLNGQPDTSAEVGWINGQIKELQRCEATPELKAKIKALQQRRTETQFKPDYMELVCDRKSDFKKAVRDGFKVNGIEYSFLLGTTSGLKNNTVIFCSSRLHDQLVEFLDCGRDLKHELVPAKFCAYAALACSASNAVSDPKGVLVVPDCFTSFKEKVITIDNSESDEPVMMAVDDYEIRKDCSDGFGTMTPERAALWSEELGLDYVMSGCNTRCAFEKGMLVTFDHVAFAEEVYGASPHNQSAYFVRDVWGDLRDIREVDVILTESMLKLWDSYSSLEDYLENCRRYGYTFSITKVTPKQLENDWTLNYQFTQSYDLTDEELAELVRPTVEGIRDVLGGDYRKMLLYFYGGHISDETFLSSENDCRKALMVDPDIIKDPSVYKMVREMINRRINEARINKLNVRGNYQIACGDPYALWQNIFGLEVTGLLGKGEVYSRYWADGGTDRVVLFRAPMTNHSNIRTGKVSYSAEAAKWYEHIKTMMIVNSWDTIDSALNGMDYDGDMIFSTDNEILLRNTKEPPTLICLQDKAKKAVIDRDSLVQSCLDGFGSKIGLITNRITSQLDVQSRFESGTLEHAVLQRRIESGQKSQQDEIDHLKGIISRPAPIYWFDNYFNAVHEGDNIATRHHKGFNHSIVADKRPYFMIYRYPKLRQKHKSIYTPAFNEAALKNRVDLKELLFKKDKTEDEHRFLNVYTRRSNVSYGNSVPNRICRVIENDLPSGRHSYIGTDKKYDYSAYKTELRYDRKT